MPIRSTILAALALASASAVLLAGCAGRAPAEPAAARATDRSCTASVAQAKSYATHTSTVKSATTASCVLKYINTVNVSGGLRTSVAVTYSTSDDHEYGDPGGDGIVTKTYSAAYTTTTLQGIETFHQYDELGDLNTSSGTDLVRVRYLDTSAGSVYTNTPTADARWTTTKSSVDARHFVIDHAGLFPSTGLRITSWTKAVVKGHDFWTFALGSKLNGGTIKVVLARGGQILSVDSSIHYDGGQRTLHTTFTGVYGPAAKHVTIPEAVRAAAWGH